MTSRRRGFTLIELLVVIAILATIAGGVLVSYDGLETDAAQGMATFNLAGVDRATRTYATLNKAYPDNLDSLVVQGGAAPEFCRMLPAKLQGSDADPLTDSTTADDGKLSFHTLTAAQAAALRAAGVTTLRTITDTASNIERSIPNRAFDDPSRGGGSPVAVADTVRVAIIDTDGLGATDSSRLRDIAGLDATRQHIVVALGLGNNSTICAGSGVAGALSEAPFYTNVAKNEYGRFLLLFHVATDANDDGDVLDAGETFATARFLATLDTRGDWLDEEFAEFTNQKP